MRIYIVDMIRITSLLFYNVQCSRIFNVCTPDSAVLASFFGVSLIGCATMCKSSGTCLSVNINKRIQKCDVLSVSLDFSTTYKCAGWMYLDIDFISNLLTDTLVDPAEITQEWNKCSFQPFSTKTVHGNMRKEGSNIKVSGPAKELNCGDTWIPYECTANGTWIPTMPCINECFPEQTYSYAGDVSVTRGGIQCQRWDSFVPHEVWDGYLNDYMYPDGSVQAAGNRCRDPEFFSGNVINAFPWCYTTDSRTVWQFCDIRKC